MAKEEESSQTVVNLDVGALEAFRTVGDPCLIMLYGPHLGRRYSIETDSVVFGREEGNDIVVKMDTVSREHFRIFRDEDGDFFIEDLGSTNGTFVNGMTIRGQVFLNKGDLISAGGNVMKFLSAEDMEGMYFDEIYKLTIMDPLTEVYNKRFFLDTLGREIDRSRRYGHPLSLILFDIDHFKRVNDTYGHLVGDQVLQNVALLGKKVTRRQDFLARYGGEEFVLILPETNLESAVVVGNRLRKVVERTDFNIANQELSITVSVGVAQFGPQAPTTDELIDRADAKMYEAKNAGRNTLRY